MKSNLKRLIISVVAIVSMLTIMVFILTRFSDSPNNAQEKSGNQIRIKKNESEELVNDQVNEHNELLEEGMYLNPVFEPVLADPSIIKGDDGYFYAYGTEDDWADGRGSRIVPIIRSNNLIDWEFIANAFNSSVDWKEGWIWAPDIAEFNDKYYLYYSVSTWGDENPAIGVATADRLEGPFKDYGKITDTKTMNGYTIDPMLYVDDGVPYLFFGGITSGIFAVELTQDGLSTVGDSIEVIGKGYEAPYFIERNGYYYFFGSSGSCCKGIESSYNVNVGRSKSLLGPYENEFRENMMRNRGKSLLFGYFPVEEENHVVGPGHNAIITDDSGTDWIVYHGILANKPNLSNGVNRRSLFIDKIDWIDGWPEVENSKPSITAQQAPYIETIDNIN